MSALAANTKKDQKLLRLTNLEVIYIRDSVKYELNDISFSSKDIYLYFVCVMQLTYLLL